VKLVFKGPSHIPPHLDSREIKRGDGETERQWYYQGRPLLDEDVASTDAIEVISNSSLSSKELADLMAAADVYLSAYKAEGFNLPVLESMAVGTPVIVTKGGPTDDFTTEAFAKYAAGEVVPGKSIVGPTCVLMRVLLLMMTVACLIKRILSEF
jgi:glycosyltransferase involved in cell wall biosynthesis